MPEQPTPDPIIKILRDQRNGCATQLLDMQAELIRITQELTATKATLKELEEKTTPIPKPKK